MKYNIMVIIKELKACFHIFKSSFEEALLFESIYKVVTSFVFIPFLIYIFNSILVAIGFRDISNNQLISFGFSINGIIGILLISIFSMVLIFIEVGVIIIISKEKYFHRKVGIIDTLGSTLSKLPKILGFGTIFIIGFMLLIIPYEALNFGWSNSYNIQVPKFLMNTIYATKTSIIIYVLVAFLLYYFYIKYIFVFQGIIIEKLNITKALKKSSRLTKGSRAKIGAMVLVVNFISALIICLILLILMLILLFIMVIMKAKVNSTDIQFYTTTFAGPILFIISILMYPINIILATQFYFTQKVKLEGKLVFEDIPIKKISKVHSLEDKIIKFYKTNKIYLVLIIIVFFIISGTRSIYFVKNIINNIKNVKVVAHRGICTDEPENSMSAIKSDIKNKIEWAEIDVQETKDGTVVLMHDQSLKRLTGLDKTVKILSFDEIEKLNLGYSYSSKYKEEKIPTLEDVISVCKGKLKLIIELKPYGNGEALATKVVNLIEKYNFIDECVIHSLDYQSLLDVKKLNSKIITGYIIYMILGDEDTYQVDFFTIEQAIITSGFVRDIHKSDKKVFAWTVDNDDDMTKMLELNVDEIISNKPILLNKIKLNK